MTNAKKDFKVIQNHLKETGFVFQGSEIYGGLANTWDYGPLGVLLTKNIKDLWWQEFIAQESNNFGLDAKILMNPSVWIASGHVNNFSDPLIENRATNKRYRADHVIETIDPHVNVQGMTKEQMGAYIKQNAPIWENQKAVWGDVKDFHLMFETFQGAVEGEKAKIYLRPETAQGIFVNFLNVQRSMRAKVPFGIGQIGKSFRNEVTPGNFTFRTREFEQMELEYFVKPGEDENAFDYYVAKAHNFAKSLGIKDKSLQLRPHAVDELSHYSKATTDIEFEFPFGWGELMGIANRTDFDLKAHSQHSGEKLEYRDPYDNSVYTPYVIEPSIGMDRLALAIIVDAFEIEPLENDGRILLKLDKRLAPYKFAVLPLNKKIHAQTAKKIYSNIVKQGWSATYDDAGSIGKRYRRQDAIGTPFCLTVIDQSATENKVTIRFRDSMEQVEMNLDDLQSFYDFGK